jgi:hypothetical protein
MKRASCSRQWMTERATRGGTLAISVQSPGFQSGNDRESDVRRPFHGFLQTRASTGPAMHWTFSSPSNTTGAAAPNSSIYFAIRTTIALLGMRTEPSKRALSLLEAEGRYTKAVCELDAVAR